MCMQVSNVKSHVFTDKSQDKSLILYVMSQYKSQVSEVTQPKFDY